MADGQIVRFKIGEAFPADDPLARWMTVCAMAFNDLLLVNRWLFPRLEEKIPSEPHETFYLGRLSAAHLYEAATFLGKADRLPEVKKFVATLSKESQEAYKALLKVGKGGSGTFHKQLKHARHRFFHYHDLLLKEDDDHERLKQAMAAHALDEQEQGISRGVIRDLPVALDNFRAEFADDIATEMMLPESTEDEFSDYIGNVSEHTRKFLLFARDAFNTYTHLNPDAWDIEVISGEQES